MTREQVRAKLGEPLATKEDPDIQGFEKDMYKDTEIWGEPEVTYNAEGRVVRVFGELPLEWDGGKMDKRTTEAEILKLFPTAVAKTSPSMHPWRPGEILIPDHSLFFMTDRKGFFSQNTFYGVGLALPYAYEFHYYWATRSGGGSLLATTGKRSYMLTRAKGVRAQALGCYFCVKRIEYATYQGELQYSHTICPTCKNQTVLAGTAEELSDAFLQSVHDAWFTPKEYDEG